MIEDLKTSNYISTYLTPEDELLKALDRETNLKTLAPRMLSGHVQGNLLTMLAMMITPKRILEIGTFTGYATLALAKGLAEDGLIFTIDIDEETDVIAKKYFAASGVGHKIQPYTGNALDIIPQLDEVWDIVFIDADKLAYAAYYDMVVPKVRQGGVILIDNVLWKGKVYEETKDKKTNHLHELNAYIANDTRVMNMILPLRDGINVVVKL